jgi:hypothetical protein
MIPGRIGCELAVLTVLCVLTIFLFPAMQGPYSIVNGPVTALQATRAAARTRKLIVQAALISLWNCLTSPLAVLSESGFHPVAPPECNTILRC